MCVIEKIIIRRRMRKFAFSFLVNLTIPDNRLFIDSFFFQLFKLIFCQGSNLISLLLSSTILHLRFDAVNRSIDQTFANLTVKSINIFSSTMKKKKKKQQQTLVFSFTCCNSSSSSSRRRSRNTTASTRASTCSYHGWISSYLTVCSRVFFFVFDFKEAMNLTGDVYVCVCVLRKKKRRRRRRRRKDVDVACVCVLFLYIR